MFTPLEAADNYTGATVVSFTTGTLRKHVSVCMHVAQLYALLLLILFFAFHPIMQAVTNAKAAILLLGDVPW